MAKKVALGTLIVFVFVFIYDWVFHGMLLKGIYEQTPQLWRPESDMKAYCKYMLVGQLIFALFMCLNFKRQDQCQGIGSGVKFGLTIGGLFVALNIGMYAWMPLPNLTLPILWSIGSLIQAVGIGILLSLFCGCAKKAAS